jgi:hypothetical protein
MKPLFRDLKIQNTAPLLFGSTYVSQAFLNSTEAFNSFSVKTHAGGASLLGISHQGAEKTNFRGFAIHDLMMRTAVLVSRGRGFNAKQH